MKPRLALLVLLAALPAAAQINPTVHVWPTGPTHLDTISSQQMGVLTYRYVNAPSWSLTRNGSETTVAGSVFTMPADQAFIATGARVWYTGTGGDTCGFTVTSAKSVGSPAYEWFSELAILPAGLLPVSTYQEDTSFFSGLRVPAGQVLMYDGGATGHARVQKIQLIGYFTQEQ